MKWWRITNEIKVKYTKTDKWKEKKYVKRKKDSQKLKRKIYNKKKIVSKFLNAKFTKKIFW